MDLAVDVYLMAVLFLVVLFESADYSLNHSGLLKAAQNRYNLAIRAW